MGPLQPGHYWKTPFIWEPGCAEPPVAARVRFEAAPRDWLSTAIGQVMAHSLDESDRYAISHGGVGKAAADLMAVLPQYFVAPEGWARAALDACGQRVGFVLPVLFKDPSRWKEGQPQGTIFYMGVLPEYRGHGHGLELVHEATRVFIQAACWRIFCDTGSDNAPMVGTFRRAGYKERTPWQRAVA